MLNHTMAAIRAYEPALPIAPVGNLWVFAQWKRFACRNDGMRGMVLDQVFSSQQLCLPMFALVQLEAQPVFHIFQIGVDATRRAHRLEFAIERNFLKLAFFLLIG